MKWLDLGFTNIGPEYEAAIEYLADPRNRYFPLHHCQRQNDRNRVARTLRGFRRPRNLSALRNRVTELLSKAFVFNC